jgi:hypothetical protein
MAKTEKERKEEAKNWNSWKPGSGRKGWSPWGSGKTTPPAQWRDGAGRPLKSDGSLDTDKFIQERTGK